MPEGQGIFEGQPLPNDEELDYEATEPDWADLGEDFSDDLQLSSPILDEVAGKPPDYHQPASSARAEPRLPQSMAESPLYSAPEPSSVPVNKGPPPEVVFPAMQGPAPQGANEMFIVPAGMPHERAHMLGMSTIAVGVGTVMGMRWGGVYGALSGSLFAGAAVNAYRALQYGMNGDAHSSREAAVSGSYAVATALLASYLAYRGYQETKQTRRGRRGKRHARD
jgi:hypothetical protein